MRPPAREQPEQGQRDHGTCPVPRDFDSDSPTDGHAFVENVDCECCGITFEAFFHDVGGSLSFQDMSEPPVGTHSCPGCKHVFTTELTGWTFYNEAG